MSGIEYLAPTLAVIGTIATGFFAWRGKKEDTAKNRDDTVSEMFATQGALVKELSDQVSVLSSEITKLRTDNGKLTEENEALRTEVRKLTSKIDELIETAKPSFFEEKT